MKKKIISFLMLLGVVFLAGSLFLLADGWVAFGSSASGTRLQTMVASKNYKEGQFFNPLAEAPMDMVAMTQRWFANNNPYVSPSVKIPVEPRVKKDFSEGPDSGLRITWLGHSTMLIEIDGKRILTDPVWGKRASPFSLFGPERFHEPPLSQSEIPVLDAVVISHDHYDHLDKFTIRALRTRRTKFIVPLGVGAHLAYWGVPSDQIIELDWWDETTVNGVQFGCAPSRHFSGRHLADRNKTLWASWAIKTENHNVFFSGDTAMHKDFKKIGARWGPFDATMMEVGAYNEMWADVHLGPEQAVEAHQQLGGGLMFPVHWGTFDLAMHGWTEPVERLIVAAKAASVPLAIPKPGQMIEVAAPPASKRWWPKIPWQTAVEHPNISSGL